MVKGGLLAILIRQRPVAKAKVTMQGTLNAYGYGKGTVLVAGYRNRQEWDGSHRQAAPAEE